MRKYSRVYIEITNVCNKSCSFCPGTARAPRFMSIEELAVVLDKLSPYTNYVYFHLMGEPLLHPDLPEFIRYARSRGFNPMITTNGSLLSECADALLGCGLYKINISLHSFEGESSEERIRYIKECANFARRAAKDGTIVTLRLWNGGAGIDNSLTLDTLKTEFCKPWLENNRGTKMDDKIFLEYGDRFEWPDVEADYIGDSVYCHGLLDHFGILSDGTIVPCCLDRDGAIPLGNVFTDDLSLVLRSDRCEKMREGFRRRCATEELCRRCGYARRF